MKWAIWEPTLELEARRQFGAFHISQARAHGLDHRKLHRMLQAGLIRWALPGVYVFVAAPSSYLQRCMIALLWAGPTAALGKRSAAALHGLDVRKRGRIQIITERPLRAPNRQIAVYRRAVLPGEHVHTSGPLRITSIDRTLFDLAWELDQESFDVAVDGAISRRLTTLQRLWEFWMQYHACGRNGSARFRHGLERRVPSERPPTNRNERRLFDLLERRGLPRPLCQVPLYDGGQFVARPDFVFPEQRLVVEVLSRRWHGSVTQRMADDERAARLDALGWRVVRIWWDQVERDPDAVARLLAKSLSVPVLPSTGR